MPSNLCCFVSLNIIFETSCPFCTMKSMYSLYANSALSSSFTPEFLKIYTPLSRLGRTLNNIVIERLVKTAADIAV